MSDCDLDTSVPDWIIDHPETSPVFQSLDIDTCCGGKSLAYACQQRGLEPQTILKQLLQCLTSPTSETSTEVKSSRL